MIEVWWQVCPRQLRVFLFFIELCLSFQLFVALYNIHGYALHQYQNTRTTSSSRRTNSPDISPKSPWALASQKKKDSPPGITYIHVDSPIVLLFFQVACGWWKQHDSYDFLRHILAFDQGCSEMSVGFRSWSHGFHVPVVVLRLVPDANCVYIYICIRKRKFRESEPQGWCFEAHFTVTKLESKPHSWAGKAKLYWFGAMGRINCSREIWSDHHRTIGGGYGNYGNYGYIFFLNPPPSPPHGPVVHGQRRDNDCPLVVHFFSVQLGRKQIKSERESSHLKSCFWAHTVFDAHQNP